ncbi:MAG: histidine phosphatase family protein [Muricomes sp.]
MEIVMIRHFQTQGNLGKKYIGRTDEPLSEGIDFEHLILKRQKECENVDRVAVSPMKRCIQTAALLFPGKTPLLCDKMRECDFGIFEGKSYEELKDIPDYQEWLDSGGFRSFPEGEGFEGFQARCVEGFSEIVNSWIEEGVKNAAMVVHGGTIMAVLSWFDSQGREFYHWQPENGGGYRILLDEARWKQGLRECWEIQKL